MKFISQLTTCLILTLSVLAEMSEAEYERKDIWFFNIRNWYGAFNLCKENGMNVLAIESTTENDLLYVYFRTQGFLDNDYWIGANDLEIDHFFVWASTGSPIKYTFTNWNPGEPKSRKGKTDRCAHLEKNFKWNISNCYAQKYVICQEKV